jgi:hypothetical protein
VECHLYAFSLGLGDANDSILFRELVFFPGLTWGGQVDLESLQEGSI